MPFDRRNPATISIFVSGNLAVDLSSVPSLVSSTSNSVPGPPHVNGVFLREHNPAPTQLCRQQLFQTSDGIELSPGQIVPRARNLHQHRARGNKIQRCPYLLDRPERVSRPLNEQHRRPQFGEMRGSQLPRLARCVQRIRQQQQTFSYRRFFRRQHGRLPAAIRLTAQNHFPLHQPPHCRHRRPQTVAILPRRRWRRRPERPPLPKRQIAAQHTPPGLGE